MTSNEDDSEWGQAEAVCFKTLSQNYLCRMAEPKNRKCWS
jgi:hypothetical protein